MNHKNRTGIKDEGKTGSYVVSKGTKCKEVVEGAMLD